MLRVAFRLHASRPRPLRCFHFSARRLAQPEVLNSLEASPIVQAVSRRMQRQAELQSQVSSSKYDLVITYATVILLAFGDFERP